jgi:hypothetical protein
MVFFLASISAFMTWLTLSYSQFGHIERLAGTAVVFLAVGGTLTHYVLSCIKRHCRHDHRRQAAHGRELTR